MVSGTTDQAILRLAKEMTSWNSIELTVHEDMENYPVDAGAKSRSANDTRYIETNRSQRMLAVKMRAEVAPTGAYLEAFCDGKKCANVIYRGETKQDHIDISRHFGSERVSGSSNRPSPLSFFYVGKIPLYEALSNGKYLGNGRISERKSEVYLFTNVKWARYPQHLVYDLDTMTSIPIRVRAFPASTRVEGENWDSALPLWVWTAKTVDQVGGTFWLPLNSEFIQYRRTNDEATRTVRRTNTIKVESVLYNKSYPSQTFWPILQPGVVVRDEFTKKTTAVPDPKGTRAFIDDQVGTARSATADYPVGWSSWVPTGCVLLGISLLVVGLVKRWNP
ncbi:hypothetical protein V5E97_36560 [Singulisphaera sp. Ch08]|uniref:Uncharacterized protein n=1 Tax=Singulisphaera sp. Ch08 TaxID=3120278 RepID=A0AAU7CF18_9BACT